MALEQMYKGIPFSPTATLTGNIAAADTIIPVSDVYAFPDAPNIATIGSIAGPNETIIYTGKTTTSLTGCTRGVEGLASDWAVDELIGRNFTAKDHADMVKNIEELENGKLDATYKVDVVNTADVSVGGKALDARQNNPNITGTLAQQINELKPDILAFLLLNGWSKVTGNLWSVKQGRQVNINFVAEGGIPDGGARLTNVTLAHAPNEELQFYIDTNSSCMLISLSTNGDIYLWGDTSMTRIYFNISYHI